MILDPSHSPGDVQFGQEALPFSHFSSVKQSAERAAIAQMQYGSEADCIATLLPQARLPDPCATSVSALATHLVKTVRHRRDGRGIEALLHTFSLSSQEGIVLMCLAEALLRIPDKATRDALIRDKMSQGNWQAHLGPMSSLFVNAAVWGLVITGKWATLDDDAGLVGVLKRLVRRGGEPLIRYGMTLAMRLMGKQFVAGQTINKALKNSQYLESKGFRYSYDMLGEAAVSTEEAIQYYQLYEQAIHTIGRAAAGRGIYDGPGISIKLSALHPRYTRAQYKRVINELRPRVLALARWARHYDIGLNIDAEEAERLDLSLDILEELCIDAELTGWNGIGFVVQAYQKRSPCVIDYLIHLAKRTSHRLMIRLVKGAYWDAEIKRAQVEGLEDYPVYTRKVHTDICYIACARQLLAAPDAVYPQFATHNAQTLAAVYHLAGKDYYAGQYEFQCLYGMGEALYQEVVGQDKLDRPCRIYAPVGTHETLLAYLVRRLLENGANTSFVNQLADSTLSVDDLVADPAKVVENSVAMGMPHPAIPTPRDLYLPVRMNSRGLDLTNENTLAMLACALPETARELYYAAPMVSVPTTSLTADRPARIAIYNPANHADLVGYSESTSIEQVDHAISAAVVEAARWAATPVTERAACLERAANYFEEQIPALMGLMIREAGKSARNAVAEVREAVDFLRYYAAQIKSEFSHETHLPLGAVVCISPWNFPLAIFTGQVAAALAAGNTVLAKPAEQTPLIAAFAVRLLHHAGVPTAVLQLLPGAGEIVGARLVADLRIGGVIFTGSTPVARFIARTLAQRCDTQARPIPFIAETGGQNAMIVDASALVEHVVADVIQSAFDSAGQRCSALRILCLQEEIADRTLHLLKGAMQELAIGNPDCLDTDVGPVIEEAAQQAILAHIQALADQGCRVFQVALPSSLARGTFVAPTLIEIPHLRLLTHEVFGPVVHVLRYRRDELGHVIDAINATGYGLTMGIHSRIDEVIDGIVSRATVGNTYVNRNVIGAVVGVQPFGGRGLSGTGPKAGGPLYLYRLLSQYPIHTLEPSVGAGRLSDMPQPQPARRQAVAEMYHDFKMLRSMSPIAQEKVHVFTVYREWLKVQDKDWLSVLDEYYARMCQAVGPMTLVGPTGEQNIYILLPRGTLLGIPTTARGARAIVAAALASGNRLILSGHEASRLFAQLPPLCQAYITIVPDDAEAIGFDGVICELTAEQLPLLLSRMAERSEVIIPVQNIMPYASERYFFHLELLLHETVISINTTAAGGNASLMTLG